MSHWLESGSDTDNDDVQDVQEVESSGVARNDEPNSYWFEFSDNEAEEHTRGSLMSKEQRSTLKIENLIQECDYLINSSSEKAQQRWLNGQKKAEQMTVLVNDHKSRYTAPPGAFLEFLGDSLEWASTAASAETQMPCVPVAAASSAGTAAESEIVSAKRQALNGVLAVLNAAIKDKKESADDDKELRETIAGWRQQQKFLQVVDQLITDFAKDLEGPPAAKTDGGDEEEEGEAGSKDKVLDEASMTKTLNAILDGSADGTRKQLGDIVKESARQRLVHLQVTATSLRVKALVQADKRLTTWSEALESAKTAFRLANSETHPVQVATSGAVAPGRAVIKEGFASLVVTLREALLFICQLKVPEGRGAYKVIPENYLDVITEAVSQENLLVRFADQVYQHYSKKQRTPLPKDVRRQAAKSLLNIIMDIVGFRNETAHAQALKTFSRSSIPWVVVRPTALETIENIRQLVYQLPTDEQRGPDDTRDRATLYYANQLTLHGDYDKARDLLITSQLRDRIVKLTFKVAILYNRVLAQIGLAAFEGGNYALANQTLTPLFDHKMPNPYAMFILGQSLSDPDDRWKPGETADSLAARELARRSFCLPPHHFLPFQKLELAAYCATLLDECVPEARRPFDRPRSSEHFHRVISRICHSWGLEQAINTAYKALKKGDAREALDSLFKLSTINEFSADAQLRLRNQIKESALRIFFYVNLGKYLSFSLAKLADSFELDTNVVRNILNQLILQRDSNVVAFWNAEETHIKVDRGNPSTLEHLMECTAEKAVSFSALANGAQAASGKFARRGRFWTPRQQ